MEDNIQHIHPNASKSGLTISECHKSPSKILNCQRSMPIIVHNINSSNRFVGGADEESAVEETFATILPESVQNIPNSSPSPPILSTPPSSLVEKSLDESAQLKEDSQNKQLPASGPCCFCSPQTPGLVGDRKVDEIIEYVHQNLAEAGKALASLGENFEHDLKVEPHIQVECRKTVSMSRRRKRRGYN